MIDDLKTLRATDEPDQPFRIRLTEEEAIQVVTEQAAKAGPLPLGEFDLALRVEQVIVNLEVALMGMPVKVEVKGLPAVEDEQVRFEFHEMSLNGAPAPPFIQNQVVQQVNGRLASDRLPIVVEDVADLWALERAGVGAVKYHVLGGVLSPLDGVGPDDLSIDALLGRAHEFNEIVLAVNATVEGQTTAHYITDRLHESGVKITRLAHGVPIGGELDYLDEGTLSQALKARTDM